MSSDMEMFCVYTPQIRRSKLNAINCVKSGKKHGYQIELYESVYWKNLKQVHRKLKLKRKYKPEKTSVFRNGTVPATRMANGTTHYLLYKHCVNKGRPIVILEHDAIVVGEFPESCKDDWVIQISSHMDVQWDETKCYNCNRAQKMRRYNPDLEYIWPKENGVQRHPLTGTNGTSGYVIGPGAAQRMIEVIERDGVSFADRIRTEYIGENNLKLQIPQSVLAFHNRIKSHKEMK